MSAETSTPAPVIGSHGHAWPCRLFYTGNWDGDRPARPCSNCTGCPDVPDLALVEAWLDDDSDMRVPNTQWGQELVRSIRELVRRERSRA